MTRKPAEQAARHALAAATRAKRSNAPDAGQRAGAAASAAARAENSAATRRDPEAMARANALATKAHALTHA